MIHVFDEPFAGRRAIRPPHPYSKRGNNLKISLVIDERCRDYPEYRAQVVLTCDIIINTMC